MRLTVLTALALLLAGCASSTEQPPATSTPSTSTPAGTSPAATSPASSTPTTSTTPPTATTPVMTTPVVTTPTGPTPALSGTKIIEIGDFRYDPEHLVVEVGSKIRVQNEHTLTHTVTSDTGVFDTGNIKQSDPEFTFYLNQTGTYPYHCKIHPTMRGNITVIEVPDEQEPTEPTPPEDDPLQQDASIFDFDFRPRSPTWPVGTTVTWTNTGKRTHTVTANDGSFDSGNIPEGGTFVHTFSTAGTITYRCKIHPSMTGTITIGA